MRKYSRNVEEKKRAPSGLRFLIVVCFLFAGLFSMPRFLFGQQLEEIDLDTVEKDTLEAMIKTLEDTVAIYKFQEQLVGIESDSAFTVFLNTLSDEDKEKAVQARLNLLVAKERYMISELKKRKAAIQEQRRQIQAEIDERLSNQIQAFEGFLASKPQGVNLANDTRFKLAQLYYEEADRSYSISMEKWRTESERADAGLIPVVPKRPERDLKKSVKMYEMVVQNSQDPKLVPYSLYSLGWSYFAQGDSSRGFKALEQLVTRFPNDSVNAPDAWRMIGDYWFDRPTAQGNEKLKKAIETYKNILPFWNSPRYQDALYLLGWCYYNNHEYGDAISYLTLLVDEVDNARSSGLETDLVSSVFREEALQYIALSFIELGAEKAGGYLAARKDKPYSPEVLEMLAGLYLDIGNRQIPEYIQKSSAAYSELIKFFPNYENAPFVWQKLAWNYNFLGQQDSVYSTYEQLYRNFNRTSEWARTARLPKQKMLLADSLAAASILDAAKYYYQKAGSDPVRLREATEKMRAYVESYPDGTEAYDMNLLVANTYSDLKDYTNAFKEYLKISQKYKKGKYREVAAYQAIVMAQEMVKQEQARPEQAKPEEGSSK